MTAPSGGRIVAIKQGDALTYERKEAKVMYLVVHHRVINREKFLATDPQDIGGNAPAGVEVRTSSRLGMRPPPIVCGRRSRSTRFAATSIRLLARSVENTYFEVDAASAMGLPVTASAGA